MELSRPMQHGLGPSQPPPDHAATVGIHVVLLAAVLFLPRISRMVKAPRVSSGDSKKQRPAHGLDRKYKPWRRKQSRNASKGGSLKQQLRGQVRLQQKLLKEQQESGEDSMRSSPPDDKDSLAARLQLVQTRIQDLEAQIAARQRLEQTRQYAKESHGARFLERQRLTRLQRRRHNQQGTKRTDQASTRTEAPSEPNDDTTRRKLALDQVYVAHYYPVLCRKYLPLFRHGERRVDPPKVLRKRAHRRQQILKALAKLKRSHCGGPGRDQEDIGVTDESAKTQTSHHEKNRNIKARNHGNHDGDDDDDQYDIEKLQRVRWIATDLYDLLPNDWSVEDEQQLFGCLADTVTGAGTGQLLSDDRFTLQPQQQVILEAAAQVEAELQDDNDDESAMRRNEDDTDDVSDGEGDTSADDDDDADPVTERATSDRSQPARMVVGVDRKRGSGGDPRSMDDGGHSSSDSDSESDDDEEEHVDQNVPVNNDDKDDSSSQSSSSSDSSEADDRSMNLKDETKPATAEKASKLPVQDDDDDFLVPATDAEDVAEMFAKPRMYVPGLDRVRGDKSKGWETQRQRPGQFKKKRVRR